VTRKRPLGLRAHEAVNEQTDVGNRLLAPAARLGHQLPVIGVSPPPSGQLLTRAADGTPWIISDYRLDPSFEEHGGVVVPRDVAAFLNELRAAGASWDRTLVAHQLPPDWTPEQPLPRVVPEARTAGIRRAERATDAGSALLAATARAAGRLAVAAATTGARAAAAGTVGLALAMAEAIVLDPVIVAGVDLSEEPLVAWVELARWSW